tara:strand:+ start:476 stop:703 length:228 start_codon:yes stop_codon:yes gene_type:complete
MCKNEEYKVGDLVKIKNQFDKPRQMGIITEIKDNVHIKSVGTAAMVVVYWFPIAEFDWEYTFFLEKIDETLTDNL